MCMLLITEQGAQVKKESRRIYVEKDEVELCEIQTRKIDALAVMGYAQITTNTHLPSSLYTRPFSVNPPNLI